MIFTKVNQEECIACGACSAGSSIFENDDEGLAYSTIDNNKGIVPINPELEEELFQAKEGCPTEAIEVKNTIFK